MQQKFMDLILMKPTHSMDTQSITAYSINLLFALDS